MSLLSKINILSNFMPVSAVESQRLAYTGIYRLLLNTLGHIVMAVNAFPRSYFWSLDSLPEVLKLNLTEKQKVGINMEE